MQAKRAETRAEIDMRNPSHLMSAIKLYNKDKRQGLSKIGTTQNSPVSKIEPDSDGSVSSRVSTPEGRQKEQNRSKRLTKIKMNLLKNLSTNKRGVLTTTNS